MNPSLQFRPPTPQTTFDRVARRYDRLNAILSLGLDHYWRRQVARTLSVPEPATILDVANGTGSLAMTMAHQFPQATLVGIDLNEFMLAVAQERLQNAQLTHRMTLVRGSAEQLPFPSHSFDAVTIAFAIDDMGDRQACAAQMFRTLKPGGQIALLELSLPEHPLLLRLYRAYLRIFPVIGRWLGRGGYGHLRQEILTYRGRAAIEQLLTAQGFTQYQWHGLSGGLVTLHWARKPL